MAEVSPALTAAVCRSLASKVPLPLMSIQPASVAALLVARERFASYALPRLPTGMETPSPNASSKVSEVPSREAAAPAESVERRVSGSTESFAPRRMPGSYLCDGPSEAPRVSYESGLSPKSSARRQPPASLTVTPAGMVPKGTETADTVLMSMGEACVDPVRSSTQIFCGSWLLTA
ncbi:hypothetical protein GCM10010329_19530 [Streptomyces spiroverticillatus]|nr:hypothetical protein GCM10010329_19530 [Streptomyces spiroverticillatus]